MQSLTQKIFYFTNLQKFHIQIELKSSKIVSVHDRLHNILRLNFFVFVFKRSKQ